MIEIDYRSKKPIYEQIIEQIKLLVLQGHLKSGDAIPSVCKMAQTLQITPSTVAKAYQELERQKVIETIRAKGTFISENVEIRPSEEELGKLRGRVRSEIIEMKRMGFSEADTVKLVQAIYREI